MTTSVAGASKNERKPGSRMSRLSTYLYQRPGLLLLLLLGPPLLYMGVVYLGSLAALLVNSFFHLDDFTGLVVRQFTLRTYGELFTYTNLAIVARTAGMALAVTLADAVLAFPLAFYMAQFASRRLKPLLYLLVLIPLWSSYLVRVYAWKQILAKEGILSWFLSVLHIDGALKWVLGLPGIGGPSLSVSLFGIFIVFVYVWLPYMILPINAMLERIPKSMSEASGDLGARPSANLAARHPTPGPTRDYCRLDLYFLAHPWAISSCQPSWGTQPISSGRRCSPTRAPPATFPWRQPSP